jgi:hypothetical protein
MKNVLTTTLVLSLTALGCGDQASDDVDTTVGDAPAASEQPIGTVTIVEPSDGAEVPGSSVTVRLATEGVPIVIAGDMTPNTGHHHLYLDADLTPASEPVPTVPNSIVHMGDASDSYTFENVEPGEHRLIAVVADGAHFPLQPWVVDTVTFVVP